MEKMSNSKFSLVLLLIAFLSIAHLPLFAQSANKNMMTERTNFADSARGIVIHQEISFKAAPQQVYSTLLDSKEFSACTKSSFDMFTVSSAKIDAKEGGTFSLFDGHIVGRILELVPNERIVEAWRVVDWAPGAYSIARFDLLPDGSGTKLIFDHIGFPDGLKEHLTTGWQQHYWDALKKYFHQ
jgi:activator of HSP90 ATPase